MLPLHNSMFAMRNSVLPAASYILTECNEVKSKYGMLKIERTKSYKFLTRKVGRRLAKIVVIFYAELSTNYNLYYRCNVDSSSAVRGPLHSLHLTTIKSLL
jgi:hypothetical protein